VAWGAALLAAAVLLAVGRASAQPTWKQEFELVPGWNAIYLQVDPAEHDPAKVFAGLPVRSVWTRGVEPGGVEFVCQGTEYPCRPDPVTALREQRGWVAYVPAGSDAALAVQLRDIQLVSVEGNRAFLIELGELPAGQQSRMLTITGRPLVPLIDWQANTYSLVGFQVDPDDPPTFAEYLGASEAHTYPVDTSVQPPRLGQTVYRLAASGVWERIAEPDSEPIVYGEAYWVYSATGSDFVAPLAVEMPTSDGLRYGRTLTEHTLRFANLADTVASIRLEVQAAPDAVPLSHFQIGAGGLYEWLPLSGSMTLTAAPRGKRGVRLAVRRGQMSEPGAGVLKVSDGRGTLWIVPIEADRDAAAGAAAAGSGQSAPGQYAGLWVGGAVVEAVSQPLNGSVVPVTTLGGRGKKCIGGAEHGTTCQADGECDGRCAAAPKACAGGIDVGRACQVADDCRGAPCITAGVCLDGSRKGHPCGPKTCAGGPTEGSPCHTDANCGAGGSCQFTGACTGGANAGLLCRSNGDCPKSDPNDDEEPTPSCQLATCPGSTCDTTHTLVCDGGENANLPCTSAAQCPAICEDAGRGSDFFLRLIIHVDGTGQARLLKQVTQMWKEGTTNPPRPTPRATPPAVIVEDGRFVLVTDDEKLDDFGGATIRDGTPVGRRVSSPHFDFTKGTAGVSADGNALTLTGDDFGVMGAALEGTLVLTSTHPTNPYRHPFHPDHDNRDAANQPLPDDSEVFAITRKVTFTFEDRDPSGFSGVDFGVDTVGGAYSEEITGLYRNRTENPIPITVGGYFRLKRITHTAELNP
jgi:hypothetical protein